MFIRMACRTNRHFVQVSFSLPLTWRTVLWCMHWCPEVFMRTGCERLKEPFSGVTLAWPSAVFTQLLVNIWQMVNNVHHVYCLGMTHALECGTVVLLETLPQTCTRFLIKNLMQVHANFGCPGEVAVTVSTRSMVCGLGIRLGLVPLPVLALQFMVSHL